MKAEDGGRRTEDGGQVGNGLTLKVFRKHIKRLVNYAEAGDGEKIREELKRRAALDHHRGTPMKQKKERFHPN